MDIENEFKLELEQLELLKKGSEVNTEAYKNSLISRLPPIEEILTIEVITPPIPPKKSFLQKLASFF